MLSMLFLQTATTHTTAQRTEMEFKLGNEVLLERYRHLIEDKRVGLITNQSGVNRQGESLIDILANDPKINLVALYGPEHGIDGKAAAGVWVESYTHPTLNIPVYSLYGATRMPTVQMLQNVDVLLFDIQDIGARTYTYMSTLNYAMVAAKRDGKQVIVLDRPNPLGGLIAEGPMLEDRFKTFVGVDNLPKAHGMTAGELARFYNRNIGANLIVIPMEGWTREMIWQDTGLPWVRTSPNIPDIASVFGYMATGLGEGTGIFQADQFKWIGGRDIDSDRFANLMNGAKLPGVTFVAETRGSAGGVRLQITDYRTFNPALTGIHALAYAKSLNNFTVPKSGQTQASIVMFDKIMGTDKIGQYLEQNLTPQQIVSRYKPALDAFKVERQQYLIYGFQPSDSRHAVIVGGTSAFFDVEPYIDSSNRVMVPLRAIGQALGANVHWEPAAQRITLRNAEKTIVLTVNSRQALVNGEVVMMDTVPVLRDSRTMVPVRFVSEHLGAGVQWHAPTRTVHITPLSANLWR